MESAKLQAVENHPEGTTPNETIKKLVIIADKGQADYEKVRDGASEELKYLQDEQISLKAKLSTPEFVNVESEINQLKATFNA